jgi:threonine aldolase
MRRRSFLATPAAAAAFQPAAAHIYANTDGVPLTPAEYARLIGTPEPDTYSRGGVVETLEKRIASVLGKESAIWIPTGTLANHIAVRRLAGQKRRVLVQHDCHLYRDSGDCTQTLSGLTLVPLSTFTLSEVELAVNDATAGRVETPVGAIQIESPIRRRLGERFDFDQMKAISTYARKRGIGLHLDGARLFIESAYTSRPVREYAALFDTVYISMYKYFNAASGAILAGPKSLIENLFHTRRMFGGGLHQVWPFAAVALHFLDGFEQRFRSAVEISERVLSLLSTDSNFAIERVANGTNIFRLRASSVNAPVYRERLELAGITASLPRSDWFTLGVNETWRRASAEEIVARFRKALG